MTQGDSAAPAPAAASTAPSSTTSGVAATLTALLRRAGQSAGAVVASARQLWLPQSAGADASAAVIEPGSASFAAPAAGSAPAAGGTSGTVAATAPRQQPPAKRARPGLHPPIILPHAHAAGCDSDVLKCHVQALQQRFASSAALTAVAHHELPGCTCRKRLSLPVQMGDQLQRCTDCDRLLSQPESVILEDNLHASVPPTEQGINTAAAAYVLSITASLHSLLMMLTADGASVRLRALGRLDRIVANVFVAQQAAITARALLNPQGGHLTRAARSGIQQAAQAPPRHAPRASDMLPEIIAGASRTKPSGRGLEWEVDNLTLFLMSLCSARTAEVSLNSTNFSVQEQGSFVATLMSMGARDPVRLVEDASSGAHPMIVCWRPGNQFMTVTFEAAGEDGGGPCAIRFRLFHSAREALYFVALKYTCALQVDGANILPDGAVLKLLVTTLSLPVSEASNMVSGARLPGRRDMMGGGAGVMQLL
jgi:hypothetical protein